MARKGYSLGSLTDYVNTKFSISGGEVTGNLNVQGTLSEEGKRVFSPNNKPTAADVGALPITGGVLTGLTLVDRGDTIEPQVGVRRSGHTLYLYDSGTNQGVYAINAKDGMALITRNKSTNIIGVGDANEKLELRSSTDIPVNRKFIISSPGDGVRLLAPSNTSSYILSQVGGANNWSVGKGDVNDDVGLYSYVHRTSMSLRSDGIYFNKAVKLGNNTLESGSVSANGDLLMNASSGRRHLCANIGSGVINWYADPNVFRWRSDVEIYCDGNGNFNDVYIRSDKRLKSNIVSTEDNLSKVLQLNPVKYDKKKTLDSEETEEELGLIAQEVEKIIPLAVDTSDDETQLKALKPYALIATLIGAVKEQQKQIDELRSLINQTK